MKQDPKKDRKNRHLADFAGHGAAFLIVAIFVTIFAFSSYQLDGWRTYIYRGTVSLANACRLAATKSTYPFRLAEMRTLDLVQTTVPHKSFDSVSKGIGPYFNFYYKCHLDKGAIAAKDEIMYLHTGWIGGDSVTIHVNGQQKAAFKGPDKPSILVNRGDFDQTGGMTIEILAAGTKIKETGMVGLAPMAIGQGTATNFRILGLETLLLNVRPLYQILPLLTLGVILVFGWFFGLRSRLLAVTLLFFVMAAMENALNLFSDFIPLPVLQIHNLRMPFKTGALLTFAVFGLELLGLNKRWILRFQAALFVLVVAEVLFVIFSKDLKPQWMQLLRCYLGVGTSLYLIARGALKLRGQKPASRPDKGRFVVNWIFVGLAGVVLALNSFEVAKIWFSLDMRIVEHYMNLLMPLFIGGILLYTLYLTEQTLAVEKEARSKLETELSLASNLQGVMVPKDLTGGFDGWSYEIESKPFGHLGGDWAKAFNGKRGSLLALGDVVGKGPTAALTHSGIAAVWESQIKLWDQGKITTEDLIAEINTTMYDLFRGQMNTTFAICEVIKGEKARVAAGGNFWLHLSAEKSRPITSAGRILIGVKPDFSVKFEALDIKPGDFLVTFTDGVLEGNRPVKQFVRRAQEEFAKADKKVIRALMDEAGKDHVHPDDASSLIMHYTAKAEGAAA